MLHVVLYQPEIPPNTGNVMRLCANTGASLHLVGPLGFHLDDTRLRRAGLDYRDLANVSEHRDWNAFRVAHPSMRLRSFSTRAQVRLDKAAFKAQDGLLFGPESRGLPAELMKELGTDLAVRLPMADESRSLNLSNSVAVGLYEAWRQLGYQSLS